MGYSGRYHAASLAAVFLALAIGILIGVGFGSDVVSGTAEDLEDSLSSDLDQAQRQSRRARGRARPARAEFGRLAYPALVDDRLRGREIAIVAFGDLDESTAADVRAALEQSGAKLSEIAVVREPAPADSALDAVREQLAQAALARRGARADRRGGRDVCWSSAARAFAGPAQRAVLPLQRRARRRRRRRHPARPRPRSCPSATRRGPTCSRTR